MHEISIHVYPTDCDMLGHVNARVAPPLLPPAVP
jgi:acyl-CoA thioesterase FadM